MYYEAFGLSGEVILNLLSIIENPGDHAIYFDNFFITFHSLSATGTIQEK